MPSKDFDQYAIQHPDGRWLYHLPYGGHGKPERTSVLADGQPMTRIADTSPWWSTDHRAQRISATYAPRPITVGYAIKNPDTISVLYPATLTKQEWEDHRSSRDTLWDLYDSVQEAQEPYEEELEGPWYVLEGTEPDTDGPSWIVNLPQGITERPEYHRCFPGYIAGLRAHLYETLRNRRGIKFCFNGYRDRPNDLFVTIEVPFEKPETSWRSDIGRRGQTLKTGRNVPKLATREIWLPIPANVTGPNYATARAEWDRQVAFWLGVVASASVKACNTCRGTGHVADGAEQYTTGSSPS
jgi:hypothetical protein